MFIFSSEIKPIIENAITAHYLITLIEREEALNFSLTRSQNTPMSLFNESWECKIDDVDAAKNIDVSKMKHIHRFINMYQNLTWDEINTLFQESTVDLMLELNSRF